MKESNLVQFPKALLEVGLEISSAPFSYTLDHHVDKGAVADDGSIFFIFCFYFYLWQHFSNFLLRAFFYFFYDSIFSFFVDSKPFEVFSTEDNFVIKLHIGHLNRLRVSFQCFTNNLSIIALWGSCNGGIRLGIFHFKDHFKQKCHFHFLIHWVLLKSLQ